MSIENLEKNYDSSKVENRWYEFWENNHLFAPTDDDTKPSFSIVIPPPNVTGKLHMGHAMDETMQDILVRYKRLKGFNTLWYQAQTTPASPPRRRWKTCYASRA